MPFEEEKSKMKKMIVLILLLYFIFCFNSFATEDIDSVKVEAFESMLNKVLNGKESPEVLTDSVIVKIYNEDGTSEYKKIMKDDYYLISKGESRNIEFIQPNYIRYACGKYNAKESLSWGKGSIGVQTLIDKLENSNEEIIVAVLDTGVDSNHEFLKDRMISGYNAIEDNFDTTDRDSHGTHVSGIIKDSTSSNIKIMPVKVLDDLGYGEDYSISKGIYYAADHGADVINMSLGGPGESPMQKEAIEYAIGKNVVVVVAAGNDSKNTKYFYPAGEEEVIVVSAVDNNDEFAIFSNYGESVDIAGPGVDINSSVPNNKYESFNGTSMATPYVAGVAAMLKLEDVSRNNQQVEQILKNYTDDRGILGKDDYFGMGIINFKEYIEEKDKFAIISPLNNSTIYEKMTVKFFLEDTYNCIAKFYINNDLIKIKDNLQDGYNEEKIKNIDHYFGNVTLKIVIEKNDRQVYKEELNINLENYNTSIKAKNVLGEYSDSFEVNIYEKTEFGYYNCIKKRLSAIDGEIRTNIDYDKYSFESTELMAIAYDDKFNSIPIYIQKISKGENILFQEDVQKITFKYDIKDAKYSKDYFAEFYLKNEDGLITSINSSCFKAKTDAEIYVSRGKHTAVFRSSEFNMKKELKGSGETVLILNKENAKEVVFCFNDKNVILENMYICINEKLGIYQENTIFLEFDSFRNYYLLKNGDYNLDLTIDTEEIGRINLKRDLNTEDIKHGDELKFGYKLESEFIPNKNTGEISGFFFVKDKDGNYVSLDKSSSNDGTENDKENKSYFYDEYLYKVILENKKTGEKFETPIEIEGSFKFDQTIYNGEYYLYTDFDTKILDYENKKIEVKVSENSFSDEISKGKPILNSSFKNLEVCAKKETSFNIDEMFFDPNGDKLEIKFDRGFVKDGKIYLHENVIGDYILHCEVYDGVNEVQKFEINLNVIFKPIIDLEAVDLHDKIKFNCKFSDENINKIEFYQSNDNSNFIIAEKFDEFDIYNKQIEFYFHKMNLEENETYYFKIRGIREDGSKSAFSEVVEIKIFNCDIEENIELKDERIKYIGNWEIKDVSNQEYMYSLNSGDKIEINTTGYYLDFDIFTESPAVIIIYSPSGNIIKTIPMEGKYNINLNFKERIEKENIGIKILEGSMGLVKVTRYDNKKEVELDNDEENSIILDNKEDILLDKIWRINFNKIFEREDILEILLKQRNKTILSEVKYFKEDKYLTIKPIVGYSPKTEYKLIIKLKNNKSYLMKFITK